MPKRNKDKKAMQKRRQKSLEKKRQKQKKKRKMPTMIEHDSAFGSSISEMDVNLPDGFRAVSNSQAAMEFAKPFMNEAGEDMESLNRAVTFGQLFWNHAISLRLGMEKEKEEAEIIDGLIKAGFPGKVEDLRELLKENVERFNYMFPAEMQELCGQRHMIMRNVEPVEVEIYDYSAAKLSEDVIPLDAEDEEFVRRLRELDEYVILESDYDDYEKLYIDVTKLAMQWFDLWLEAKNAPEHMRSLWGCLEIYLTFVYAYGHDRIMTLKQMSRVELEGFFFDHLLRKMSAEPQEYAEWPAAIKFFYQFLEEKGYMEDSGTVVKAIDEIEPFFIKILKKRFG